MLPEHYYMSDILIIINSKQADYLWHMSKLYSFLSINTIENSNLRNGFLVDVLSLTQSNSWLLLKRFLCCQKFILKCTMPCSLLYLRHWTACCHYFLTLGVSESLKRWLSFLGRVVVWQGLREELQVQIPALSLNSSYLGKFPKLFYCENERKCPKVASSVRLT